LCVNAMKIFFLIFSGKSCPPLAPPVPKKGDGARIAICRYPVTGNTACSLLGGAHAAGAKAPESVRPPDSRIAPSPSMLSDSALTATPSPGPTKNPQIQTPSKNLSQVSDPACSADLSRVADLSTGQVTRLRVPENITRRISVVAREEGSIPGGDVRGCTPSGEFLHRRRNALSR